MGCLWFGGFSNSLITTKTNSNCFSFVWNWNITNRRSRSRYWLDVIYDHAYIDSTIMGCSSRRLERLEEKRKDTYCCGNFFSFLSWDPRLPIFKILNVHNKHKHCTFHTSLHIFSFNCNEMPK